MKFLKQVADYYMNDPERRKALGSYTFVFPNKRSAMHMRKYLKDAIDNVCFMPKLVTITSFTQEYSARKLASPTELLFILYDCYKKVLADKGRSDQQRDFDSFIFWGNIALHDFSDIDAYLANPDKLFRNLKGLKEIESTFLTEEQIAVAQILGDKRDYKDYLQNFWKHLPSEDKDDQIHTKFLKLWELMGDLYKEFNNRLKSKGLTYSGRQSHDALQEIKQMGADDFGGQRFAFIGFYVLSSARTLTLKHMGDMGVAEFFWDTASPMLTEPGCRAGDFILPLSRQLKAPEDFELEKIESMPKAHIYPVPSNAGQTKVAAYVLEQWAEEDKDAKADDTATQQAGIQPMPTTGIVLPSESLLAPMLNSIPPSYLPINVAMSVPYSSTSFAGFFLSIMSMHEATKFRRGNAFFYYRDVLHVLTNPYAAYIDKEAVTSLIDHIRRNRIYLLDAAEVADKFESLAPIFRSPGQNPSKDNIHAYLDNLIKVLSAMPQADADLLRTYGDAVDQIFDLANNYGVTMTDHTYFFLVKRLLGAFNMQLSGSPVWGLQVMDIPDARVLDYDNLIMLSLNESVFPRRNPALSLIPDSLRSGYGLPTPENEEVNNSYQFFRLISRAKRLALTYDSRMPDLSGGEISRYMLQLIDTYDDAGGIEVHKIGLGMEAKDERDLKIRKVPEIMADVNQLRAGGTLRLSASSLKTYLKCPMQFYLCEVKKLKFDNVAPDFMDPASFGSIVHKVAERFYQQLSPTGADGYFMREDLKNSINLTRLTDMAAQAMNEIYYFGKYEGRLKDIPGEGRVLAKVIAKYLQLMLEDECEGREFKFVSAEFSGKEDGQTYHWKIDDDHIINFTMSIDRIDELRAPEKTLRFIDYKTGTDSLETKNFEEIFENHKCHAIFQLLLYSLAYSELEEDCGIMPMLYLFKKISQGIDPIKIEGKEIFDYRKAEVTIDSKKVPLRDAFRQKLVDIINEIFDVNKPFEQTNNRDNCRYCLYSSLCGRLAPAKS